MENSRGTLFFVIVALLQLSRAEFELCNPEQSSTVFKFTKANCPFGVLFDHPITAYCMQSTNEPEYFLTDICDAENYTLNTDIKPFKIHLAFRMDEEAVDEASSCLGDAPDKCNATAYTEASTTTMTEPGGTGCDPEDEDDIELTDEEKESRMDVQVANQTERLFKYMLGLITTPANKGPDLRVVKLLKQSFKILAKFCDTRFVPLEFGQDVLEAFLFLFRESDKFGFKDISVDDYKSIKKTLEECERRPKPFNLNGQICKTCANVHSIEKNGKSRRYIRDEFSFEWGKYDVPVDATWGVMNFVHGLCYGNYYHHVNYHHLYQREMERLILPPLLRRWSRPVILHHEDLWDHILSATVKNAMRNLDVCIAAAYQDTPFLHRLERPNLKDSNATATEGDAAAAPPPPARRRKRSLPTMLLDDGGLEGAGWCFQTEQDMLETVEAYIQVHCPENKKVLEDVQASLKEEPASPQASNGTDTNAESSPPPATDADANGFEEDES